MSFLKTSNCNLIVGKLFRTNYLKTYLRYYSSSDSANRDFDLVVVGGGSGGIACAKEAASFGKSVAILDHVEPTIHGTKWGLGGTCVNVGCIPKKLCHHASLLGEAIDYAPNYGWNVSSKKHDWSTMIKNVTDYVRSLNFKHRVKLVENSVKYINAKGTLLDSHHVKCVSKKKDSTVQEMVLQAKEIVIATGKRPRMPNIPGKELCITSDDIFWRTTSPGKTLCIGAGYVSLELASFLQGLGYPTTVMARSVALSKFDQQMATLVVDAMQRLGTRVLMRTMPEKFERTSKNKIKVTYRSATDGVQSDIFDTVIMAVGRTAMHNFGIGLKEVGVQLDEDGCVIGNFDSWKERSSVSNIFAIGDSLQNGLELTPVAARAGKLLAKRLYGNGNEHMDYKNVPTTVFTSLEYSFVGQSEEEARRLYGDKSIDVYHAFYKPLEYTITLGIVDDQSCYIKAIVKNSATQEVLGLHMTGPNAGEVMQGFAVAFRCGLTYPKLVSTIGIHPTVAEEITKLHITKSSGLDPTVTGC